MNTREELLNGLGEAVNIIRQLANIQQRLNNIRGSYRNTRPLKKFSLVGKILIGFWILMGLMVYSTSNEIGMLITTILLMVLPHYLFFSHRKKKNNERIEAENKQIISNNEQLRIQEQNTLNELKQIQILYQERLSSWYPVNYCSVDASEFFYNLINNYRADSLKEAINLYETHLHQQRVETNQQKALNQQMLGNLLSAGSLVMQGATLGAINNQTASVTGAVNNVNDTLNRIRRGY